MKTLARLLQWGLLASLLSVLLGCGTGAGPAPNSQPEPIVSVSLTEHNLTLGASETHQFAATVTGSSNTQVTWSISCFPGNTCGSIDPSGLYTAPSVVSTASGVTITAASQADPSKTDSAIVELRPITVEISPVDAWVVPGATQNFTASALYDHRSAGVTWALGPACSDSCGTLKNITAASVTYTAPVAAPDSFSAKLTAASVSDPSKKAEITIMLAATGGMAEGDYAFLFHGWDWGIANGRNAVVAAGRFHADDQGKITQGVEDINSTSDVIQDLPFTGTYSLGANGRGSLTFITAQGNATYHMVLDASKSRGRFVRYDAAQPDSAIFGSGYFEMQDKAAFSLATLAGPYAFGVSGTLEANRLAAVGRFDADASGAFTGGTVDVTQQVHVGLDPQLSSTDLKLTGLLGAPSASTGRGTATLNWGAPYKFAYYIISDQKILLVQINTGTSTTPVLSGEIRRQKGPFSAASFNAPVIFSLAGVNNSNYGVSIENAAVGRMVPGASGSVTGVYDDNGETTEQSFTGSYTVAANGRSELQLKLASAGTSAHVAYFFNPNEAFLMQISGTDALFGRFKPQSADHLSEASLTGSYLTYTGPPDSFQVESDCGLTTFDGAGGITASVDVSRLGNLSHLDFYGTYTVAPNGRGTLIFSSPATGSAVFWVVSPTEIVSAGEIGDFHSFWWTLLDYEKQEATAVADVR